MLVYLCASVCMCQHKHTWQCICFHKLLGVTVICLCRYVNGKTYMEDVADALEEAKEEIFITDWWWVSVRLLRKNAWSKMLVEVRLLSALWKCENPEINSSVYLPCFNTATSSAASTFSKPNRKKRLIHEVITPLFCFIVTFWCFFVTWGTNY